MNIYLEVGLAFIFGTVIGSFLNVVIYRLPKGEPLTGRSRCTSCNRTLEAKELIPIISWLVLGGRCNTCNQKISARYLLVELLCGVLFAAWLVYLWPIGEPIQIIELVRLWFITSILITVFFIDLDYYLILDKLVFPAISVLLVFNLTLFLLGLNADFRPTNLIYNQILAAVLSSGFFYLLWLVSKGKWIGLGDAKLMIFLGLAVGWPLIIILLLSAFYLGAIVAIPLVALGKKHFTSHLPFATFLVPASLVCLAYGKPLLEWYLSLLGIT